ncbi:Rv3654c family TadE-like protein [Ornithinimicrobium avium]|uniref:Rv3654c family TadE-like protein n=1 Tax=Ornithinimicrobium avium TaxID=2283195 RepID=UPI001D197A93|nr:Rv3654c family TadE-like protein [Ornithinimicrobium avium]
MGSSPLPSRVGSTDRGSGTVLAIGLIGVLTTLLVAGLLVAAVALAGQRARSAADLAALAVAGRALEGTGTATACAAGGSVAGLHGAVLVSCTVVPDAAGLPRARVEVRRDVPGTSWSATARAVAGGVMTDE